MELPKIHTSGSGMLSGIKSKLGFQGKDQQQDDYAYDDGYYDDGYGDDYDDGYEDYAPAGDDYGDYGDAGTRPSSGYGRRGSITTRRARPDASSDLVSIDDVRAYTRVPENLTRDPLPERRTSSSSTRYGSLPHRGNRVLVDDSTPSTSTVGTGASARTPRSSGYSSLFDATDAAVSSDQPRTADVGASFDPYAAFEGSSVVAHAPSRSMSVLRPLSYGDVERVAKIVKAGDAAVLCLKDTPDDLAKRVLDFSFGVACYAEARVDCIADKVFVVAAGAGLTEAERTQLNLQGVL